MEIQSMNLFGFILWSYMLMLFYTFALYALYYSADIRKRILEELEKDGLLGGYSYIRHKWTSPVLMNIIGFLMFISFIFFAIGTLAGDIKSELNLLIAIPLLALNTFVHHKIGFYFIKTNSKIKEGEKKTMLGEIEIAIIHGSVPRKVFWIYLAIAYVIHFAALLKVIF